MDDGKLEIMALLPMSNKKNNDSDNNRLLSLDALKTADLTALSLQERASIKFVVCKSTLASLKSRNEPFYLKQILPYGEYHTFEEALNYYYHKQSGNDLKKP